MTTLSDAIGAIGAGAWPDWVGAVATSVAVLVAAFTYRKSRNDDHIQQARKVYVLHSSERREEGQWLDTGEGWAEAGALLPWPDEVRGYQLKTKGVHLRARVHNASDEVISNVEVVVSADNVQNWPKGPRDARYVIAAIPPGADHVVHFIAKDLWSDGLGVMGLDLSIRLRFTDSAGTHWTRRDARPVRELKRYAFGRWNPGSTPSSGRCLGDHRPRGQIDRSDRRGHLLGVRDCQSSLRPNCCGEVVLRRLEFVHAYSRCTIQ